jgi:hypothetical protein
VSQTLKSAIAVVGIDIGKNSFHVVGLEQRGATSGEAGAVLCGQKRCRVSGPLGMGKWR